MKKHLLFISFAVALFTVFLIGCQNEESELQPTGKIEFLKAKSKEFAKKYGVNITLNDDSIAKYAEQMTVESMEDDYKTFSEAMIALKHKEYIVKGNTLKKGLSKKYFARRKTESETTSNPFKDRDETFRQVVDTEINCGGKNVAEMPFCLL